MDSDQGKLFVGGISWETAEENLAEYFGQFGQVVQTVVVRDTTTGKPRGFGFVVFADPSLLDTVLQDKHTIDGRTVEVKRAISREEQQNSYRSGGRNGSRSSGSGGNIKTKKIFVGGLPPTLTEEGFRQYFESYGVVTDVVVMFDQSTQRPRGFGFISFDTEEAVDRVLHKSFHDLNGKTVEVKRALPKDGNSSSGGHSGGGGYQGYDSSNSGNGSYDGRADGSGQMQPHATGGAQGYGSQGYGAQGYGSPGYGVQGYGAQGYAAAGYGAAGYGAAGYGANNAVGYGAYGAAGAGYGVPSGGYGNPTLQNASYGNAQQPGSAPYGGTGFAATGQSQNGAAGAAYGYNGGNDGSYGNQGSYGAVRGYPNNGNSEYTNGGWSSDPSQNGNYGTAHGNAPAQVGYGGPQAQQAQQQ